MEEIVKLYQLYAGKSPRNVIPLQGAGSNRRYFRLLTDDGSIIGVIGTNAEENRAFIELSHSFQTAHLPAPEVLAVSEDDMCYLQEDLGTLSLYDFISEGRNRGGEYSEGEIEALAATIRKLPQLQFLPATMENPHDFFRCCYPQQEMDRTSVMFDLNYFKYCFVKFWGCEFNEYKLQHDFELLADHLLSDTEDTFMYRDFQTRNVMLRVDAISNPDTGEHCRMQPYFIDYQGGRRGPIYYDVASFLWQSSARFSDQLRERLINEYLDALKAYKHISYEDFMRRLHLFVLFRLLQVLGAYGFRGLWEKKQYFIDSIPMALDNLSAEIERGTLDGYPYLKSLCSMLRNSRPMEQRKEETAKNIKGNVSTYLQNDQSYLARGETRPLTVTVYSFSFKRGIPQDESGNGGGYVFDCRSTHNPGRYDDFKPLTGLDEPVINFLEEDGEILTFLDSVYRLVDFHVNRFMQRGFTHMQISFGCTGGRHRSVYCAEHTAEHIHKKFGVNVEVIHREQNISRCLNQQPFL